MNRRVAHLLHGGYVQTLEWDLSVSTSLPNVPKSQGWSLAKQTDVESVVQLRTITVPR